MSMMRTLFHKIKALCKTACNSVTQWYTDFGDHYQPKDYEYSRVPRFISVFTVAFRFLLRYIPYAIPVIWVAMVIVSLVMDLKFFASLLVGLVCTALILLGIFLVFSLENSEQLLYNIYSD